MLISEKEKILLNIGSDSLGIPHTIQLNSLPNLFVSYSIENQLPQIFASFITQLENNNTHIQFAVSFCSKNAEQLSPLLTVENSSIEFLHGEFTEDRINNIDAFIKALVTVMKSRSATVNLRNKVSFPVLIVFIDDIFEVMKSVHRRTPVSFLQLLITAAACKMYFIIGSSGIYRGLLNDLINITPALQKKLNKSASDNLTVPLGSELVMSGEGLLFYRGKEEKIFTKLYPIA